MRERTKTRCVWEYDPETKRSLPSYHEEVVGYSMDDSERDQVVLEIMRGAMTSDEARSKCKLASVNSIYTWIGKYVSQSESLSFYNKLLRIWQTKAKTTRFES